MKGYLIFFSFLLIVGAIMAIATCSIGIQCYNKCDKPNMNAEMPKNKIFLIINLILSIAFLIASIFVFQFVMTLPPIDLSMITSQMGKASNLGSGGLGNIAGKLGKLLE
jgi:hypothetical protein